MLFKRVAVEPKQRRAGVRCARAHVPSYAILQPVTITQHRIFIQVGCPKMPTQRRAKQAEIRRGWHGINATRRR